MKKLIFTILILLIGCKEKPSVDLFNSIQMWPNGDIPYMFSDQFTEQEREYIRTQMNKWELCGNIKFESVQWYELKGWTIHPDRVYIIKQDGNAATTGYDHVVHTISLTGNFMMTPRTVVHEFGHILGLKHEQQRPDRDLYVRINWNKIEEGKEFNFEIVDNPLYVEEDFNYDYNSVMHYFPYEFSNDGSKTIEALNGLEFFGGWDISEIDCQKIEQIYGQSK